MATGECIGRGLRFPQTGYITSDNSHLMEKNIGTVRGQTAPKYKPYVREAIAALEESGASVIKRQEFRQKHAVVDENIVW